jgi:hypothetical protein
MSDPAKNAGGVIRTVYLYIFALLGLVLTVIGTVRTVDMGLKAFVFTRADEEQRSYARQPPAPPIALDPQTPTGELKLSEFDRAALRKWQDDYARWQAAQAKVDPITSQRQREASTNVALLAVGLPLYLLHWRVIRREHGRGTVTRGG